MDKNIKLAFVVQVVRLGVLCVSLSEVSPVVVLSRHSVLQLCMVYHIYIVVLLSLFTSVLLFVTLYVLNNALRSVNVC